MSLTRRDFNFGLIGAALPNFFLQTNHSYYLNSVEDRMKINYIQLEQFEWGNTVRYSIEIGCNACAIDWRYDGPYMALSTKKDRLNSIDVDILAKSFDDINLIVNKHAFLYDNMFISFGMGLEEKDILSNLNIIKKETDKESKIDYFYKTEIYDWEKGFTRETKRLK